MGNVLKKMWCGRKKQIKILLQGLDAAGKTTLLYKLKLGEVVTTIPTIGFNVETVMYKHLNFTCWDIGGRDKMRPLFRHYYPGTEVIIYVVDSNDRERLPEVKEELDRILQEDELRDCCYLFLANKQDLPGAAPATHIEEQLDLHRIKNPWAIFPVCTRNGENLYEALDWLSDTIEKKHAPPPSQPVTQAVLQANTATEKFMAKQWHMLSKLFWGDAAKSAKPVTEAAKSAKPVTEAAKSAKPVTEAAKSAKPVTEAAKSAKPVTEAAKSAKPVMEAAKSAEPVIEDEKSAEPAIKVVAKSVEPVS